MVLFHSDLLVIISLIDTIRVVIKIVVSRHIRVIYLVVGDEFDLK